jgi:signal transduction histidine kinase
VSLRGRLLLTVAALVLASLAAAAWVSTRITTGELERLAAAEEGRRLETELASLGEVLEATEPARWTEVVGGWQGSFDALLFDPRDHLVAASDDRWTGADLRPTDRGVEGEVPGSGTTGPGTTGTGTGAEAVHAFKLLIPQRWIRHDGGRYRLYLLPSPFTDAEALAQPFQASAARWTVGLILGLGLIACAAAATVARRLAGPLEELTAALRAGDLSRRLETRGDDEIARLAEAFNAMAAKIEHTERLRQDLVADVAHELRTPLTNLRGEVESLEDGLLEPTPAVLASLREEVAHLERLVEDLQELALAEAGRLRLDLATVELESEVAGVLRGFGNGGGRPRLAARVAGVPAVRADPRRLRQILVNLVDNARRHTPPGGTVSVAATVSGEADEVTLRVVDTGPGIPEERRRDVFERFVRLDGSRQRATGGAGLGLAIVKQLVTAHGGRIWIEDPPAGSTSGTVFAFTLPRAR